MDITGIWKYSELKKQYNAVAAELDAVKKTATQLTNENNGLKRELDKLDKAEARIKELEAEISQPKWGYHEMLTADGIRIAGWIPVEGTPYQILSKTPAMFPQFCKEKQVPEK